MSADLHDFQKSLYEKCTARDEILKTFWVKNEKCEFFELLFF
jgi:hypothetical protein